MFRQLLLATFIFPLSLVLPFYGKAQSCDEAVLVFQNTGFTFGRNSQMDLKTSIKINLGMEVPAVFDNGYVRLVGSLGTSSIRLRERSTLSIANGGKKSIDAIKDVFDFTATSGERFHVFKLAKFSPEFVNFNQDSFDAKVIRTGLRLNMLDETSKNPEASARFGFFRTKEYFLVPTISTLNKYLDRLEGTEHAKSFRFMAHSSLYFNLDILNDNMDPLFTGAYSPSTFFDNLVEGKILKSGTSDYFRHDLLGTHIVSELFKLPDSHTKAFINFARAIEVAIHDPIFSNSNMQKWLNSAKFEFSKFWDYYTENFVDSPMVGQINLHKGVLYFHEQNRHMFLRYLSAMAENGFDDKFLPQYLRPELANSKLFGVDFFVAVIGQKNKIPPLEPSETQRKRFLEILRDINQRFP